MATNYPGSLDSFTNPGSGDALTSPSHSAQHANANDAIEAVQAELGANPSGSDATVAARLAAIEAGTNLGTNSVGTTQIAANAVGASELADNAVDTAALVDGAVTSLKLAKGLTIESVTPDAVLSANLAPAIDSWTAVGGSTFSAGTWTIPAAGGISCDIASVTNGAIVQVDVSQGAGVPLTVTLGGVTQVFSSWQNSVTVVASGSGTQTLTVSMAAPGGTITGVTVRSVTSLASPVTVGQAALRLRSYNNAIGVNAQHSLTTGSYNNAIGVDAQYSLTTGSNNNAIGVNSQYSLTTGSYNNAIGVNAQRSLTTGSYNNAIGVNAQYNLTTGYYNNAIGVDAQYNLTTGGHNNAIGVSAQYNLTTGGHNNAIGVSAQYSLTTGSYNNAIGVNAQSSLTTGSYNTALGYSAGSTLTTQNGTVCIGIDSGGTAAQAATDNEFVLGTVNHKVLAPGSFETTKSGEGVVVRSPDGTRWRLGVSNAGTVTVVAA